MHEQKITPSETKLYRAARRQGCRLVKSRTRNPNAAEYGRYMIVSADTNMVLTSTQGSAYPLDLDGVAEWLSAC